jgi:hypothetical protein
MAACDSAGGEGRKRSSKLDGARERVGAALADISTVSLVSATHEATTALIAKATQTDADVRPVDARRCGHCRSALILT